jgi:hypothetical protein
MMPRPNSDNEPVRPTAGLGGLSHVSRKDPMPRPAPAELLNGTSTPPPWGAPSPVGNFSFTPAPAPPTFAPAPVQNQQTNLGQTTEKKKRSAKPLFWAGMLGMTAYAGYMFTRRRSVDEYISDEDLED